MPENAILKVSSHGGTTVEVTAALLIDLDHAYNGFTVFEAVLTQIVERAGPVYSWPFSTVWDRWQPDSSQLERADIARLVLPSTRLRLHSVHITSPGWWKLLGAAPIITAISEAINDRHQRQRDNRAEPHLRNMEKLDEFNGMTEAALGRYRAAKEMGMPDTDLALLRNRLIEAPLDAVNRHIDSGLLEASEVVKLGDKGSAPPPPAAA